MRKTPLNDFVATLADPAALDRFRKDPAAVAAQASLPGDLERLVLANDSGAIRLRAIKELEDAGLAPRVSDKFGRTGSSQQPMNISMNSYTSSTFTSNTYTTNTYTTNTTDFVTTTTDQTTTTTTGGGGFGDPGHEVLTVQEAFLEDAGRLILVGSGIRAIADLTHDAEAHIRQAQKVLYCVADPVTERRLHLLNPTAESLYGLYGNDKPRIDTYLQMVEALMAPVRAGLRVCGVFYGHPGVFAWPTHTALRQARHEGYRAEMHAGVSADACLFADLGIDPSQPGCHSLEATSFLLHRRTPDVTSHVLLWQAECAGDLGFNFAGYKRHNFEILVEQLKQFYPEAHPVYIYEAAILPQDRPKIIQSSLDTIHKDQLTGISTLYLPPLTRTRPDAAMSRRLGLS